MAVAFPSLSKTLVKVSNRTLYSVFGPSTVHLEHEFYLLVALSLLLVASFQTVYSDSFVLLGDLKFCALAMLWLSRHLVLRWLCTWDTTTLRTLTIKGVLTHWLTSYFMAGQYFERPSALMYSKQAGILRGDDGRGMEVSFSNVFIPSLVYTWHLFRKKLWEPLQKLSAVLYRLGTDNTQSVKSPSLGGSQFKRRRREAPNLFYRGAYKFLLVWNKVWEMCGLSLQTAIPLFTLFYYTWSLSLAQYIFPSKSKLKNHLGDLDTKPFGSYLRMDPPAWTDVFFVLSAWGTMTSLLLYSRVLLPFPELVAGTDVLKAIRNEAKSFSSTNANSKTTKAKKESQDVPWTEQNKSVIAQNRCRLIFIVACIRVLENVIICYILPRTNYGCRTTGHCLAGFQFWQLSSIIHPSLEETQIRNDSIFPGSLASFTTDFGASMLVLLSALFISGLLLLLQALTLNRSYLAIMGYIVGEWIVVDNHEINGENPPAQWDPRRRYKKGDMVLQKSSAFGSQKIYKAASNSPEGRPSGIYLRATQDWFRNELGHPSTSQLLAAAMKWHFVLIGLISFMIMANEFMNTRTSALFTVLAANLVVCYGVVKAGLTNHSELLRLNEELS